MIAGAEIVTGIMIEIVVMIENVIGIRIVLAVMIQEVGVGHAPVLGSVQGTMIATGTCFMFRYICSTKTLLMCKIDSVISFFR